MKSVSLRLSEQLISQSADIAAKLGISRMAFIRQAIEHEIERVQKNRELDAMKASLKAMKANPDYWVHQEEWQDTASTLPPEEEIWWN
jgi:predicted transcriptional regulator